MTLIWRIHTDSSSDLYFVDTIEKLTLVREPFASYTGRGVRVGIIDSGVNPAHPHVGGVAGGVFIRPTGESEDYLDHMGHGTAVTGAIREKAPDALLYAVKIFDRNLASSSDILLLALQ